MLKLYFSNKKYIAIQTHPTQIVKVYIFLNEKQAFNGFLKGIGV